MTHERRVFLAGWGVVCRAGNDAGAICDAALRTPAAPRFPDTATGGGKREGLEMACAAARQAWQAACKGGLEARPDRTGLIVSTSRGVVVDAGPGSSRRDRITGLVQTSGGAAVGTVARAVGHRGPALMVSASCVSSAVAACTAADMIRAGVWDAALVGGVEMASQPRVRNAFLEAGVPLAAADGEPGVELADGAGFVVLSAEGSGIRLAGWAHRIEPSDRCGIHGMRNASRCLDAALGHASLPLDRVRFLHGHLNGNPRSDAAEREWMRAQSGMNAGAGFSWKRWTGHCLGASPVIELALGCEAMQRGKLFASPWAWYGFGLWGFAAAWVVDGQEPIKTD